MNAHFEGLNEGQQSALVAMLDFAHDEDAQYMILKGYAGTGKTFVMGRLCSSLKDDEIKVYATATTNKATKVLSSKVPVECSTIYSLIGLRLADDDETQRLIPPEENEKKEALRGAVVIVDESSMITKELLSHIRTFARMYDVKFIFVGDPAQLPPVEKDVEGPVESPVWALDCEVAELSEIVRYDGPVEVLAGKLRSAVLSINENIDIENNVVAETKQGVHAIDQLKFMDWLHNAADKKLFMQDTRAIALAFTNKQVDAYNKMIRSAMYGVDSMIPYLPGERVVMTAPYMTGEGRDKVCQARNRDEFRVESTNEQEITLHHNLGAFKCRVIVLQCEGDKHLPVLHPAYKEEFKAELNLLSEHAKAQKEQWQKKKAWADFWKLKGTLAQVEYAYAMTTHCSQGGTYDIVFVDRLNIMGVKKADLKTRLQALYVAATRASQSVIIN